MLDGHIGQRQLRGWGPAHSASRLFTAAIASAMATAACTLFVGVEQPSLGAATITCSFLVGVVTLWLYLNVSAAGGWGQVIVIVLVSLLFGAALVLGQSYYWLDSWCAARGLRGLVVWLGSACFIYPLLHNLFRLLDGSSHRRGSNNQLYSRYAAHPVGISFAIILTFWLPYLVVYAPGSVHWDSFAQLGQFFGILPLSDHHPLASTALMGGCVWVGRLLGSDNVGLGVYTAIQTLMLAWAFARVMALLVAFDSPQWMAGVGLAFFALCPIWPLYAQLMVKDTLACALFVLAVTFGLQTVWMMRLGGKGAHAHWVLFVVFSIGACLWRHDALLVVLTFLFVLACFSHDQSRRLLVVGAACLVATILMSFVVVPALGAQKGSMREAMSIPLQQASRYLSQFPDDLDKADRRSLDRVVNTEYVAQAYNPQLSDPVKGPSGAGTSLHVGHDEAFAFAQVWFHMLGTHPECFVEALLNHTFGYWYPLKGEFVFPDAYKCNTAPSPPGEAEYFSFTHVVGDEAGNTVQSTLVATLDVPVIGLMGRAASYVWLLVFIGAYATLRRRPKAFAVLIPCILRLLICLAGPMNGSIRYLMPLMALLPLALAACVGRNKVV